MSRRAKFRGGRYAPWLACLAAFAGGLAAVFAGAWLLLATPTPAPEPTPGAAAEPPSHAVTAANADAAPSSLADIARLGRLFERRLALYRLASQQGAAGVERLLAETDTLVLASEREAAEWVLYARYTDLNPEAALRHALAGGAAAEHLLEIVFYAWALADLDAAVRRAETLNPRLRASAGGAILLARDDLPRKTRAEIAARLAPQGDLQDRVAVYDLPGDPVDAWPQELAQSLAMTKPGEKRTHILGLLAIGWGWKDPRTALDVIEAAGDLEPRMRFVMRGRVVTSWADTDPAAALEWVMAKPAFQSRGDLIGGALRGWAENDPRAAAAWLNVPANRTAAKDSAREQVARNYAARNPEEAVDWVLALPALGTSEDRFAYRSAQMETVFSVAAENDPDRAARLLQRVGDGDARHAAQRGLVHGWARADPTAAIDWLNRQVAGEPGRRGSLYSSLLAQWAGHDVVGAVRHLDRLAEPSVRDRATVAMLDAALRHDAALAETLFERIENEDARQEAARALYEHLSKTDPERAERYR